MAANSQINLALRIQADMKQAINQTQAFSAELEGAGDSSGRAGQQLQEFAHSGTQAEEALGRATTQLKHMVAGFVSLAALRGAVNIADDYVTMADRIELATSSTAEYEMVQRRLLDTANNTYRALSEAQEVYIQSSIGLRDMGYSASESLDIVDSLSYSFVRNATSTDKAGSALNALTRAVNRGSVLTDHWATLLLAVPTILEDIAAVSGMTTQEISKLGYEGKLSAELLTEGLRLSLEENKAAAANMYTTVADAVTSLQNALSVYLGEANRATSATSLIAKSIELLAKNLDTVANVALVGLSAATTRYVVNLGLATKAAISSTLATRAQAASELQLAQAQAASALAAANAARAQAGLTISHAQAKVAVDAHAAAQVRLAAVQRAAGGVTALLGGPVGLAMLAASAAASLLLLRDSADDVRSSFNNLDEPLSVAVERFQALTKVGQASELDKLKSEIRSVRSEAQQLASSLAVDAQWKKGGLFGIGAASGDAKAALDEVHKAAYAAARGARVNFDEATEAVLNAADMSSAYRSELLKAMQAITEKQTKVEGLREHTQGLAAATRDAASAQDELTDALRTGSDEGDEYLKRLTRRVEDLQDASNIGRVMRDLRDTPELHDLPKEQLDQIVAAAQALDRLDAARKRSSGSRATAGVNQEVKAAENYVTQLEKQAATLGMTTAQLREYELSEKKLTGTLLERARAAQATIAANEQQEQSVANAKAAADLQVQLLQASGRETEAALLESANRFTEIQSDMLKTGNEVGLELVQQLIPLDALRVQLSGMQSEIDKALNAQQRREQSIEAQVNSGLITQIEGRKQLVELHRQTAAQLEKQLPHLREMAAMPGAMGEQARIVLETLETQILQLNTTTNELQNALRDGLQTGIAESLSGLAQGTMDLRDAINALLQSVLDSMVQIASQQLAEQATSGLMSMAGSLGGMFGGGDAANAGAEAAGGAATAAAITSASTAGATAMGTSITTAGAGAGTAMGTSITTAGAGAGTAMATSITTAGAAAAQAMATAIASASAASSGSNAMGAAASVATVAAATGGHIRGPGTGTSDSIPAWLSDYEFVTRAAVVEQPGALPFLHDFNQRGMQALHDWSRRIARHSTGGLAGIPAPALPAPALGVSSIQEPAKNMSATLKNHQTFNLIDSPERMSEAMKTPPGVEALTVVLSNDPAKFRQILGVN